MSVRARVEDASLLWQHGRLEGAFLSVLVAVAATSRRRYGNRHEFGDRAAFEQFVRDSHSVRLSVEYRGQCQPVEHIFYKWLRCSLLHEGGVPVDIEFVDGGEPGTMSVRAGGAPEYVLKLSHGWFHHLMGAVIEAPENADLFADWKGHPD